MLLIIIKLKQIQTINLNNYIKGLSTDTL